MAPRRGGGGGGSSSSGSSGISGCPGAFSDSYYSVYSTPVVYFVSYVLFFVITLGIFISQCCLRKRKQTVGRKITGPIFTLSLFFALLYYACIIIATVLRECRVGSYYSYFNWAIAYIIFSRISTYLLLVVVVYVVNNTLREHLGNNSVFFKIIYAVILGFMFCLTVAYMGLQSYNIWTSTPDGMDSGKDTFGYEQERLSIAYWIFYLLSSLAAGALSIVSLVSMRSRNIPAGDILGWVIALTLCMFLWVLFLLVEVGAALQNDYLGIETYYAFEYIIDFFQAFAFIALLCISKSMTWSNTAVDNPIPVYTNPAYPHSQQPQMMGPIVMPQPQQQQQQQQYAYHTAPNGQQYYYQQQSVHNGAK